MERCIYLLILLFLSVGFAKAQSVKVEGVIYAEADNQPIPGATIRVKNAALGVVSDINGKFTLQVPAGERLLVISFIGMKTKEVVIQSFMKIKLETENHELEETVVTAIGIRRDWKSLGYASTVVSADELTQARESNILNALAGKVAGVKISQSSGTLGGASKIQIRGASSIASVSSPLFIVDGMPINNMSYNPDGQVGNVDVGNRVGDIGVDDIESVNILKGAAATALYGARAKDGAVIITTKRGNKNTKSSISVNSSTRFEKIAKLPDFQNEYAQGTQGVYSLKSTNGWGPSISESQATNTKYMNHKGEEDVLWSYPDNIKDFFEMGTTYMNHVSMYGGNEKTDFRTGISSYNQKGVVPGTNYNRYNFSINAGTELLTGVTSRISAQYILSDSEGSPAQGANDPNVLLSRIYLLPRTIDVNHLKNNWIDKMGKQMLVTPEGITNNPYWITNKNKYTSRLDRFIGNIQLGYSPVKGLSLSNNLGTDYHRETRRKVYAIGTLGELEGKFQDREISSRIINNDFIVTYENAWNDFSLKAIAGHNVQQEEWMNNSVLASQLTTDGIYNYAIARQTSQSNYSARKRILGVYFDMGLSYKSIAFLNITGRNDWSSTLPIDNRSYFYPAVSGSFVFSELLKDQRVLDFGKLRINYAQVGSDTDPYQLNFQFMPQDSYELQYSIVNTFPHNGLLGFSGPLVLPTRNLKPQNQRAFEIGTELMFLQRRIHVDFTYYQNVTVNQIVAVRTPASSGYYFNRINAGKVTNKGFEFALNLTPLKFQDFTWQINTNFATNKQVVNEIAENLTVYNMASSFNELGVSAEKGKSFGIYGKGWLRDEQGNYVIDEETGLRKTTNNMRLGDISPKFTMGVNNQFQYKGFHLNFLIDIRHGGKLFSGTVAELRMAGLVTETVAGRGEEFIESGVIVNSDGEITRPNDVAVKGDMETYWGHLGNPANAEGSIFDASYVKLRELAFSYQLPQKWFKRSFVKSFHLGVEGRNLWLIKSHVPHIDPEVNAFGPDSLGEGVEYYNMPQSRSFGLNIKLAF